MTRVVEVPGQFDDRTFDQFAQGIRRNVASHDLKQFLFADDSLKPICIYVACKQDTDRLGGAFLGLTQSFNAAHARQLLSRHKDVNGRTAERV